MSPERAAAIDCVEEQRVGLAVASSVPVHASNRARAVSARKDRDLTRRVGLAQHLVGAFGRDALFRREADACVAQEPQPAATTSLGRT